MNEKESPLVATPNQTKKNESKVGIFLLIIFGFLSAFGGGFFLNTFLKSEQSIPKPSSMPVVETAVPSPFPQASGDDTVKLPPGKRFFEDTIMMISKSQPHITFIVTEDRIEQSSGFSQNTRIIYYDGKDWKRVSEDKNTVNEKVVAGGLVNSWAENLDSSRVLRENVNGSATVSSHSVKFSTSTLQNEISMRSLPGYTKFMSNGQGTMIIDGTSLDAYVLFTKIYSQNSADIQFYNQPFNVTTDWLAFWDTEGNFYHVDSTDVPNPTPIYKPHTVGVYEDSNSILAKTFQLTVVRDSAVPPDKYTINLGAPINQTISLNLLSSVNKAPSNAYKWYLGQVSGSVTSDGKTRDGVGIIEYIHN